MLCDVHARTVDEFARVIGYNLTNTSRGETILAAPLEDITVVSIESWMAAPSASAILADLGADVIKIEPLAGDPMRNMSRSPKVDGPLSEFDCQFDVDNRGKRSIAVALDTEVGAGIVHRIVTRADVFMCNLLIHRQERFGLDPQSVLKLNPRIVHATLTGYGTTGPDAWRPGYDVTAFFGRSGLYDASREGDDGDVPMARPAQGDHTTGLALLGAILAGLRSAERTGVGQVVETSLFETAIWTQASDFGTTAIDRAPVRRRSRHQLLSPTANRYPCGDGKWVVLNMMDTEAFPRLCDAIGCDHWLDDERFATPRGRYDHMAELVDGIDAALATRSRDEWGEIFDAKGMIWGPVLTLDEVAGDAQAHAIGMFPHIEHPQLGPYRSVNAPFRFQSGDVKPRGPAPAVGEHSRTILTDIGIADSEIDALIEQGTIASSR
jgi:crotonobetainyl-CoA:carnitine CoA-transferase CaiB-like acyl-CoA transferase